MPYLGLERPETLLTWLHFHNYLRLTRSVPTDCRSLKTGLKKVLEDRSIKDFKIAKRTTKDLFLIQELLLGFSK